MGFLFSQFFWEIIYTHQCMSLRQTAWWFGLNILWSDCHNRFSQHPSSCMDAIKRKEKKEKHFLLVMRILRRHSVFVFICCCLVSQSCLFCNPTDCSPPVSSVHRISRARILKWVSLPYSRGISQPRDVTCISCKSPALQAYSLLLNYQGSPC